jgi:hypothetical protein
MIFKMTTACFLCTKEILDTIADTNHRLLVVELLYAVYCI